VCFMVFLSARWPALIAWALLLRPIEGPGRRVFIFVDLGWTGASVIKAANREKTRHQIRK
jgi:hypothetical protein